MAPVFPCKLHQELSLFIFQFENLSLLTPYITFILPFEIRSFGNGCPKSRLRIDCDFRLRIGKVDDCSRIEGLRDSDRNDWTIYIVMMKSDLSVSEMLLVMAIVKRSLY